MSNPTAEQAEQWILEANIPGKNHEEVLRQLECCEAPIFLQLLESRHDLVVFYALSQLSNVSEPTASSLRQYLLSLSPQVPVFVRNKAASILATAALQSQWPTLVPDLLQLSSINTSLFLQILLSILEDFRHPSDAFTHHQLRQFKDVWRGYDRPEVVQSPLQILFQRVVQILKTNAFENAVLCLKVIQHSFVELPLLGDLQQCWGLLAGLLQQSHDEVSKHAVLCWQTCVVDETQVHLVGPILDCIHASGLLPSFEPNVKTDASEVSAQRVLVLVEIGNLVNLVGLEFYDRPQLSNKILDLWFRCLWFDDIDVTLTVLPLAVHLIPKLQGNELSLLVNALYLQLKYPVGFAYDFEDSEDVEEEVFREELCKVYNHLVRSHPILMLQFLVEAQKHQSSIQDMEATLRLVFHYSEGIRPPPGNKQCWQNPTFVELLKDILASNVPTCGQREVLILYYQVSVRYHGVFERYPHLLEKILASMTGAFGLQHSHQRVRSRCCYLLLKLVKATNKMMCSYVDTAVVGIQSLIANTELELRMDDTMFLFESIGLLLGTTGLDPADQQRYLTAVIQPHVQAIETLLSSDGAICAEMQLAGSVAAVANLSKGFQNPPEPVQLVLMETMTIAGRVLQAVPQSEDVRGKFMVYLQRMIACLGRKILPSIPGVLSLLIEHCTNADILFVSQLFIQLLKRFEREAIPAIEGQLLTFLHRCHQVAHELEQESSGTDIPPHVRTEQLAVRKLIYVVLHTLVQHHCMSVLVLPGNFPNFGSVLNTVSEAATSSEDPLARKTCVRFFRDLTEKWDVDNEEAVRILQSVSGMSLIPGMFQSFLKSSFVEGDAAYARIVHEFCKYLEVLRTRDEPFYRQCTSGIPALLECTRAPEMEVALLECIKKSMS